MGWRLLTEFALGPEFRHQRFPAKVTSMHGDVGGFGVSSDLTWQLYGYVGYRPTPKWLIYGGYRHKKIDYESDNQAKFFYDMEIGGPVLGVGYHF